MAGSLLYLTDDGSKRRSQLVSKAISSLRDLDDQEQAFTLPASDKAEGLGTAVLRPSADLVRPSTAPTRKQGSQSLNGHKRTGSARSPRTSSRPVWRPNGHRPEWPISYGLAKEQARARLRSPPRERPTSTQDPSASAKCRPPINVNLTLRPPPAALMLSSWEPPRPTTPMKQCELRELPEMKHALSRLKKEEHMPYVQISRRLNWPPKGWVLERHVMDDKNQVLLKIAASPSSRTSQHGRSATSKITRSTYVSAA